LAGRVAAVEDRDARLVRAAEEAAAAAAGRAETSARLVAKVAGELGAKLATQVVESALLCGERTGGDRSGRGSAACCQWPFHAYGIAYVGRGYCGL